MHEVYAVVVGGARGAGGVVLYELLDRETWTLFAMQRSFIVGVVLLMILLVVVMSLHGDVDAMREVSRD